MRRILLAATPLLLIGTASAAGNCDAIRAQIDAKIKRSGATGYTLQVVDAEAKAEGKVVGSCEQGSRKIVYARTQASSAAPSADAASARPAAHRPSSDGPILTECKDGSVTLGGNCGAASAAQR